MYTKEDYLVINNIILDNLDNLDRIILFGSYATDSASDESDIDIAIITKDTIERHKKLKLLSKLLIKFAKSGYDVDLIIKSKERFLESIKLNGTLCYEIANKGIEIWTNSVS